MIGNAGVLANHVAVMLKNARLYRNEKDHKQSLRNLLNTKQTLVKETVEGNNIDGITDTLRNLLSTSVILSNRFLRPFPLSFIKCEEEAPSTCRNCDIQNNLKSAATGLLWFHPNPSTIRR